MYVRACVNSQSHKWGCTMTKHIYRGASWSWLYDSLIYLCNHCISPQQYVIKWLSTGRWFSPGIPVSSIKENWPPRYNWNIVESGAKHHNHHHLIAELKLNACITIKVWITCINIPVSSQITNTVTYHVYVSEYPTQLRRGVLDTILCDKVCQLPATGR